MEGVRTAFKTSGSEYTDLMAYDLGRVVLKEVADRASFLENGKEDVDYVLFGTVIQEVRTSNIARDALLGAGYPSTVPAHTITQACISSNQAISTQLLKRS